MAIARASRRAGMVVREYSVPEDVKASAPEGTIYRHFAWFSMAPAGHWLGEWAGYVPAPDARLLASIDTDQDRMRLLRAWMDSLIPHIPHYRVVDQEFDGEAFIHAYQHIGAYCVDVTDYEWPVGDHRFHRYRPIERRITWPEMRNAIEVRVESADRLAVVANGQSSRPIRDAVEAQHVVDITDHALNEFHGRIFGIFKRVGNAWTLIPDPTLRSEERSALSELGRNRPLFIEGVKE